MARFLTNDDYNKQIQAWIRNVIISNDEDTLLDAELAAQNEMETYLAARYDIAQIFSTTQPANERNRLIVLFLVDITLYHLHSIISPDLIPELREKRYKSAIQWLKDVSKGIISVPGLPLIDITNEETPTLFKHGGNYKYHDKDSRF